MKFETFDVAALLYLMKLMTDNYCFDNGYALNQTTLQSKFRIDARITLNIEPKNNIPPKLYGA